MSKMMMPAQLVSGENLIDGLQMAAFLYLHMMSKERSSFSVSSLGH
jgi:hypothetical protein